MLGNLLIAYLNFTALCHKLAVLRVPESSIREPISSKTLTVRAVPLLLYELKIMMIINLFLFNLNNKYSYYPKLSYYVINQHTL